MQTPRLISNVSRARALEEKFNEYNRWIAVGRIAIAGPDSKIPSNGVMQSMLVIYGPEPVGGVMWPGHSMMTRTLLSSKCDVILTRTINVGSITKSKHKTLSFSSSTF